MAMGQADLKILISARDESSKAIGLVRGSLKGLGSVLGAPIKAAGMLTNALGKIGLAAFGIKAVISAAKGLGSVLGVNLASDVA